MGSIQPPAASQGSTLPAPGNPAGSATVPAAGQAVDTSHRVVLDGGGKVTLSGGGKTQILSMKAGWQQQWPQLVVAGQVTAAAS